MASISRSIAGGPAPQPSALPQARQVFADELRAIEQAAAQLDGAFDDVVTWLATCRGRIVVSGMGKSGLIGQKISATFASIGAPSLYLHAAEAMHGELGRIAADDVVLLLSNSGRSPEVVRLLRPLQQLGARLVAITGAARSPLGRACDAVLCIGQAPEACPLGLSPTASTTAMLVLGDALAMCVAGRRGASKKDYARLHPGGALGLQLQRVADIMRRDAANPTVAPQTALRAVTGTMSRTPGRPGAAAVVDGRNHLLGFFTDGDLRRLLEQPGFDIDQPISQAMQTSCKRVTPQMRVAEAAELLRRYRIDQAPVVDEAGQVVGLLDVQDVLGGPP